MKTWLPLLLLTLCLTVNMQAQIQVLSRADLDRVERPALSPDAAKLKFTSESIVADDMTEDGGLYDFTYVFRNIGTDTLDIDKIVTSCSCAAATYSNRKIAPQKEGKIHVKYNPKGHPGSFERKIFVYTGGYKSPAAVLRLKVNVEVGSDLAATYQVPMGKLRLRRSEIEFQKNVQAVEKCACINVSDVPVKVTCNRYLLSPVLTFKAQPEVLQPGEEGMMIIEYKPAGNDDKNEHLILLVGLGLPPSQSALKVKLKQ